MQSPSETLEQKQEYLRGAVDEDLYEDFFQFCTDVIGNVDINSWTMAEIHSIVQRFHQYRQKQNQQRKENKYSYNDYQSKPYNQPSESYQEPSVDNYEFSECKSSKIEKKSAVDLLDSVLMAQDYSTTKTQPKAPSLQGTGQAGYSSNSNQNTSNMFNEFDFWTSTVSTKGTQSKTGERSRSSNHNQKTVTTTYSPQLPKQTNDSPKQPTRNTVVGIGSFGIFDVNQFEQPKKGSPYMKKQQPHQAPAEGLSLKKVQNQNPNKNTYVNSHGNKHANPEIFQDQVPCFKSLPRSQISSPQLSIFITNHEIIQRKLLASDYPMFHLKVVPLNIECKRNYEDFVKLKKNLEKFFPGVAMPYLQGTSWLNGTNEEFIAHQKKMLQFFSRDLIRNKQIRNSRVMEDFLTLRDHKAIKRKFEKYADMQNLKGLEQLCLLEGKVKVTLNPQQKSYIDNFERFLYRMNTLYQKQQNLTESLIGQYAEMLKISKNLIALTQEMQKEVKNFNQKVQINKIKNLGHALKIVEKTYKEQYSNIKFELEINEKKLLPFLKYQRRNFMELEKLLEVQRKFQKSYQRRQHYDKVGVGETYVGDSVKDEKKGILEQSSNFLVFKYQVGYIGHQVRVEGQRVFDQLAIKTVQKWKSLSDSYLDRLTTSIDYWQNLRKVQVDKYKTDLTF